MKKNIWLSYDLGIRGDYSSLYEWLDNHNAKECGDSLAVLSYLFDNNLIEELKTDLSKHVDIGKRDRIYLIWMQDNKLRGSFLFGKRKSAPWEGYGVSETEPDEDF